MKSILPLLAVLLLSACGLAPAALTPGPSPNYGRGEYLTPDTSTPETLSLIPAPTETPTPTPVPGYAIEQLKAMTSEQKLAAAPEIEGYTKWKVAERFVFYQKEDGQRDLAYDLNKMEQRELKEFPKCIIDKYPACVIPREELENGDYWLWLNTLSQPFDPAKVKIVPLVKKELMFNSGTAIIYDTSNGPNFADSTTAPFHRDVTTGIVYYEKNGVKSYAVIRPIEYYDKNDPGNSKWVIALESKYYSDRENVTPETNQYFQWQIDTWKHWMRVTPIKMNARSSLGFEDPLVKSVFERYPDIYNRFERFLAGDVSALSGPDIFVLTHTVRDTGNTYK